jgi:hypothetical protein
MPWMLVVAGFGEGLEDEDARFLRCVSFSS